MRMPYLWYCNKEHFTGDTPEPSILDCKLIGDIVYRWTNFLLSSEPVSNPRTVANNPAPYSRICN